MRTLAIACFMVTFYASACAATKKHKPTLPQPPTKKNCKVLGMVKGKHSAVLVEKGCMLPKLTTVTVVILSKDGRAAALETIPAMIKILGYKPSLTTIFRTFSKGKIIIIFAVNLRTPSLRGTTNPQPKGVF